MSQALENLRAVAGGIPGSERDLLHICRLQGFGGLAIGHQSVGEAFMRSPFTISPQPHIVEGDKTLAVFDVDHTGQPVVFFADVFNDRIGRLWRIGPETGTRISTDPAISVPFDPKLSQVSSNVEILASDHPELSEEAFALAPQAVEGLCLPSIGDEPGAQVVRRKAFVIRAVSQGNTCALLIALHELTTGPVRQSHFRYAGVFFRFQANEIANITYALDGVPTNTDWCPRVPVVERNEACSTAEPAFVAKTSELD